MAQVLTEVGSPAYSNRDLELSEAVPYVTSLNGSTRRNKFRSFLVDINGGATVTITGAIPAGAHNMMIVGRVTTIIAGSDGVASWFIGDTDTDHWGAALALAAGTTFGPANYTAQPTTLYTTATDIVISGTAGKLIESGRVRLDLWYQLFTAPTS